MIAKTPQPPYYAVIFSSVRTEDDNVGYNTMADDMVELAAQQEGFLGVESARNTLDITVSYWQSLEAIKHWKANADHKIAREKGRSDWYKSFKVRISKVERDYDFNN